MLARLSNTNIPIENHTVDDDHERTLRMLALELVKDIRDPEDVLKAFHIDRKEYEALAQTRVFKRMVESAAKEWAAASNTSERVKLKSMALIEEALPEMFNELTNTSNPLSSRADLFGRIAKIGGLGNVPPPTQNSGEMFSIQINLGTEKPIVIRQDILPRVSDAESFEDL